MGKIIELKIERENGTIKITAKSEIIWEMMRNAAMKNTGYTAEHRDCRQKITGAACPWGDLEVWRCGNLCPIPGVSLQAEATINGTSRQMGFGAPWLADVRLKEGIETIYRMPISSTAVRQYMEGLKAHLQSWYQDAMSPFEMVFAVEGEI